MAHTDFFEQLSGMMTALLENMKKVGDSLKSNEERKKTISAYSNAYESLLDCIQITQDILPQSSFNKEQNLLI